jgi:hypothetical protein
MRFNICRLMLPLTILMLATATNIPAQTGGWRAPSDKGERYGAGGAPAEESRGGGTYGSNEAASSTITPVGGPTRANVSKGSGTLPNNQGQVWREYDIRPYTLRNGSSARPEQAIVDWILRETGYESWHAEPVGLLSANREVLRVYHTPEMQAVVADVVDRFVNNTADAYAFSLRIATVVNPNWRAKALPLMTPIPVQTPGIQGWMLAKEDAQLLISDLSRRSDYREFNSPQQLILNGQSIVISTMRPRSYVKGAVATQMAWPGYQPEMGTLEEGFSLEFSPLLSLDLQSTDAVVKLRLCQVEKMVPVKLDLPTTVAPNQRVQVDVPQLTMANLHERFHWPTDKVLLLSMGVVATPAPTKDNPLTDAVTGALPMLKDPPRADALLFVDSRGQITPSHIPTLERTATLPAQSFHGRY